MYRPTLREVVEVYREWSDRYRCLRMPAQFVRELGEFGAPLFDPELGVIVERGLVQVHRRTDPEPFRYEGTLDVEARYVSGIPSLCVLRGSVTDRTAPLAGLQQAHDLYFGWNRIFLLEFSGPDAPGVRPHRVGPYHGPWVGWVKAALWSDNEDRDPLCKGRDPARIDVLLDLLRERWKKDPDLRLLQLLINACDARPNPLFTIEDDVLIERLRRESENGEKP